MFESNPSMPTNGKYIVFKRWDSLTEDDEPQVVFFFCNPDTISGLHSLANFDTMEPHGVIAPFGSGCDSLVGFAMKELKSEAPKAVIGLFDPSARVCVKRDLQSFSIPWPKFQSMFRNMDNSLLDTFFWGKIRKRMKPAD